MGLVPGIMVLANSIAKSACSRLITKYGRHTCNTGKAESPAAFQRYSSFHFAFRLVYSPTDPPKWSQNHWGKARRVLVTETRSVYCARLGLRLAEIQIDPSQSKTPAT